MLVLVIFFLVFMVIEMIILILIKQFVGYFIGVQGGSKLSLEESEGLRVGECKGDLQVGFLQIEWNSLNDYI